MPPNSKESTEKCTGLEGALASEGPGNMEDGSSKQTGVLFEADVETNDGALAASTVEFKRAEKRKLELVWRNIILFAYVHLAALYGAYLMFTQAKLATTIFGKDFNTIMLSFSLTVFAAAAASTYVECLELLAAPTASGHTDPIRPSGHCASS